MPAYLVRRDEFFDRARLYGSRQEEYNDNRERFIFFSRSIPVLCEALGFIPDVILGNDWQTGLVMALLAQGIFPQTAGVFAIHNLGYLGLVLLAAGEVSYQQLFAELQAQHPSRFGLKLGFDAVLSHKIFAGCDMFLMPSLYEPCSLTQMFSLKYETIPIVRATWPPGYSRRSK